MTDPLQVDTDALRATSEDLAAVSSRMKNLMSSLQDKLSGKGAPWGDDATGHSFAEGPQGYLAQRDGVKDSFDAKTQLLDSYAGQMKDAADSLQRQDQA